jgi:hypothetical protein
MRGTGWLNGWRLTFGAEQHGWDGALVTIVEDPDSQVFVTLWDITPEDASVLDEWETPIYRKLRLRVDTLEGDQLAWLHVLDDYEGGLPSASYLGVLVDAAIAAGAPADYVDELRRRECRSTDD